MTATVAVPAPAARGALLLRGYRFELLKLLSQWRIRLLVAAGLIGPALFVGAVSRQSSLPTDTVFGRWMHDTGWAGSLVVLGFTCTWVLPLLTSLVAGDVFAAEDRLGTWRHLLVAVRSPRRIFAAKALAGVSVLVLLVAAIAASSVVGGLAAVGSSPLVGLDGHLLGTSDAAGTVLAAWAYVLAPTLAFGAVGLLGSVALGRSPIGLLMPALLAFALLVAQMLPLPVAVRLALPSHGLLAWRGLFVASAQLDSLLVGVAVDLAWAALATALAYRLFLRRDFTDLSYDGTGRRTLIGGAAPLAGLLGVTVLALGAATGATGSGIDADKLQSSLATSFAHLYRLQTQELGRPDVTEAQLQVAARCDKGGLLAADRGPGNDWRCVVSWRLPDAGPAVGTAIYQLDVTADGRYVADGDGPKEVNGFFQVRTRNGRAPNPLWQVDGDVDLLTSTVKG
jgi:ABC-2 type transport system permease protein